MSVSLEEAVGALAGCSDATGCGAVAAYAFMHPGSIDATILPGLIGSHHFRSLAMAVEVAYVAAVVMARVAEPCVPIIADSLDEQQVCLGCF